MASALLNIKVTTDAGAAKKEIEGFSDLMGRAALPATAAAAAITAFGADAVSAASEAQQAAGALEATFGDATAAMSANAQTAADTLGLSEAQYSSLASTIGSQLKSMGVSQADLGASTDDLIAKGGDLAAQFGGSTSEAVAALSSLMRGERDPIEKYGVSIKAADVEAQKAKMGLAGLTGEADKAATTQATLALLNEQTATSAGAFARETNTAAGAQQIATASWENATATLGAALLPAVTAAATAMSGLATWVQENSVLALVLVGVVGALAAGVLVYNGAMAVYRAATATATGVQWLWNAAMSANPLGLIVIGIAAVVAAIVWVIANWDKVKQVALAVWKAISDAVSKAAEWLGRQWDNAVKGVLGFFGDLQRGAEAVVDGIIDWFGGIPDRVMGFFNGISIPGWISDALGFLGLSAPGAEFTATWIPSTFAANPSFEQAARTMRRGDSGAPQININITGALDPVAVGRQVRDAIIREARFSGRVALNGSPL